MRAARLAAGLAALVAAAATPAAASAQDPLDPALPGGLTPAVTAVPINTYAPDVVVTTRSLGLQFVNLDVTRHDVVARDDLRPDGSAEWCDQYRDGDCPLFWSPLVQGGGNGAVVRGLEDAEPGRSYVFYCTIHPYMVGTIEVAS